MPAPLPLPIRVLVKGASTVNWSSWMGGPRSDLAFPRVLEAELLADGRPTEVRTHTMPSERASTTLLRWQEEVLGFSPDVVVLVYGHYETIHLFLPRWLERHANSLRARPRLPGTLYRKLLLRPVWKVLAQLQARIDSVLDPTLRRSRPRHVAADLERLIGQLQKIGSPRVIVFELLPPASRVHHWFPGMPTRIAAMNLTIEAMVERVGLPQVTFFRTSEVLARHCDGDVDVATPDGFHYTPGFHREIGAELARQVVDWAESQPHLQRSPQPGPELGTT